MKSSQITLATLKTYQTELAEKFGKTAEIAFGHVTQTQLSIARYYGGCKVNGKDFIYNPEDDSLIREDVVKWMIKRQKQEKRSSTIE